MTTRIIRLAGTLTLSNDTVLPVERAIPSMDTTRAPYITIDVTITRPDAATLTLLDPRDDARVTLTLTDGPDERPIRATVMAVIVRHRDGLADLRLASREAVAIGWAPITDDLTMRLGGTARQVVAHVLDQIGETLTPGTADGDLTAYWSITNAVTNPRTVSVDPLGFALGVNAEGLTTVASIHGFAGSAIRWASLVAGPCRIVTTTWVDVQPGDEVSARADLWAPGSGMTGRVIIRFTNADGFAHPITEAAGPHVPLDEPEPVTSTATGVAPYGATRAYLLAERIAGGAGGLTELTKPLLYKGPLGAAPFNPEWEIGTAGEYGYSWDDATLPDASASTRDPILPREPDALTWRAGTSAWDYLQPMLTDIGLLLYNDEAGDWHLIDPATVTGETHEIGAGDLIDCRETIDPAADDSMTGVAVRYLWTTPPTVVTAGTSGRVLVVEQPPLVYPARDAAARILARRTGSGLTTRLQAVPDITISPRDQITLTGPGAPVAGVVRSVEWDTLTGIMTLTPHDLEATP